MKMTRKMTAALALAFVFGSALPLLAEPPPLNLTLKEAIRLTFEQNLDLKVELYNPALAEADIRRSLGIYDPLLSAGASYSRGTNTNTFSFVPINVDSLSVDLGVNQLLPTGATVGATASSGWISNSQSYYTNAVNFFLSQPLLKNFGRETTELNIEVARFGKEGSLDRFRAKLNDTVAQVRNDYFRLYSLRETLEVKRTSLALSNKILDETRGRVKAGVLPAMEILNAEFGSASREKEVIDAERAVRDQVDLLRLKLQLEGAADILIADQPVRDFYSVPEQEALTQALANRPELAAQRTVLKIDDLQRRVARNRVRPDLSLNANVGFDGFDPRFGRGLEKTASADNPAWGIGLQLSYPIGNNVAENEYIRSRLLLEQSQIQLLNLEAGVTNEVKAAIRLLQASYKQLEVTDRGRAFAEERLRAFQLRNAVGLATTKDVFDVENDLVAAKGNQIQALVDYNNAITDVWRVTGVLLERQGITVSERQADPLYQRAK